MNIIVAVNSDWGIGYNGAQSIIIPEDRRHFMKTTVGGVVIAGRKTFEDVGKPLPNRKNIILTRDISLTVDGAVVVHSASGALEKIAGSPTGKVFIIGGESIYKLFLPMCDLAYITKIEASPPSDTFFPNLDKLPEWKEIVKGRPMEHIITENNQPKTINYSFTIYKNTKTVT